MCVCVCVFPKYWNAKNCFGAFFKWTTFPVSTHSAHLPIYLVCFLFLFFLRSIHFISFSWCASFAIGPFVLVVNRNRVDTTAKERQLGGSVNNWMNIIPHTTNNNTHTHTQTGPAFVRVCGYGKGVQNSTSILQTLFSWYCKTKQNPPRFCFFVLFFFRNQFYALHHTWRSE